MINNRQKHRARNSLQGGFTLMEVVIVMAMLGFVLGSAYQIFINCIETERKVEEITIPEKVGEGILTLMRRDLAGAVFKGATQALDNQVFVGIDNPGQDGDADTIYFLTTVDPTPREDAQVDWENIRTLTMIGYRLESNQNSAYTLYRKEILEFGQHDVTNAPGVNYNVYDKVKSLNIEFFDGYEWSADWDSVAAIEEQQRLQQEQDDLRSGTNSNIPRVSDPAAAEGDEELLGEVQQQAAPIPIAVRIELEIYSGIGNKLNEKNDQPVVRKFTTLVPLLASRRLALPIEDEMLAAEGGAGGGRAGGGGEDGAVSTFGADLTKGRGERGKGGSLRDKLAERPGRGSGRGSGRGGRNPAPGIRDKAVNALKNRLPSGGGTKSFGGGKRGN